MPDNRAPFEQLTDLFYTQKRVADAFAAANDHPMFWTQHQSARDSRSKAFTCTS